MRYTEGYHYQLVADEVFDDTQIYGHDIVTDFIELASGGTLTVRKGYAWDGPSGPTFDTANSMRGSLGHDALYQLMRQGHLAQPYRMAADSALSRWLEQDGMWNPRRWYWMRGVRNFAGAAADPANRKQVLVAP